MQTKVVTLRMDNTQYGDLKRLAHDSHESMNRYALRALLQRMSRDTNGSTKNGLTDQSKAWGIS